MGAVVVTLLKLGPEFLAFLPVGGISVPSGKVNGRV
jgi:hypothetical protein